ncbi:zinc-dependent alcohol dehydrogenase [Limnochorda pilosa]|uniref:Alcohol dehydrogenase n=1 Tax=Limnochorda pilosa TaxID=1555112 RepID=A0A0K2SLJ8_LIMPI|nr:alcohol dehydrogenase catalytic domain-containing protein [Limnochorda pilosa]BAS27980.1 alcohol dehydrogenase [Limnochorda pilosa]
MRAAIFRGPLQLAVEEVPTPQPPPGGVLVRTLGAAVCGTDVKTYLRGHPLFQPPVILGHEFVGEVVAVGAGAEESGLRVGDRVAAAPYVGCGSCPACRHGLGQLCSRKSVPSNGAFAEYVALPREIVERGIFRLRSNDGDPHALASVRAYVLTEPMACVVHSLEKVGAGPGSRLLVVGAGPMGLLHVLASLQMGGAAVLVTDLVPERLELAASMGGLPMAAGATSLARAVAEATGGAGVDAAILSVEAADLVPELLAVVRPGGTVNLFAGMARDIRTAIDPYHVHYREVGLTGTFGFDVSHFQRAGALIQSLGRRLDPLLGHTVSLDEIPQAISAMKERRILKAVVDV